MKLSFRNKPILWAILLLLLTAWAVLCFALNLLDFSPFHPAALICFFIGCMCQLEIRRGPRMIYEIVISIALACVILYSMQSIASRQFADAHPPLTSAVYALNILCILAVQLLFLVLTARIHIASIATAAVFAVHLTATYLVLEFRGREVIFQDFSAFGTAMNVLPNYEIPDMMPLIRRLLYPAAFCFALTRLCLPPLKKSFRKRLASLVLLVACACMVTVSAKNYAPLYWTCEGAIINGMPFNFCLTVFDAMPQKPEGYSEEVLADLAAPYENETANADTVLPDIVVIMNESFADLSVLGSFETNTDPLPNLHKLQDTAITGDLLSPAFGGNTVMPEWEFLTGGTSAFSSEFCSPFQLYVKEPTFSVVHWMNRLGYATVGMHPYAADGWERDKAYGYLGFEKTLFLPDFPQEKMVRDYVSDEEVYDLILEELDSTEQPAFIFAVTMQNHGGYETAYPEGTQVYPTDDALAKKDVCNYLTLAHETDRATAALLEALAARERPTYVLLFGDHQPLLSDSFYANLQTETDPLLRRVQQYITPFFLWSNTGTDAIRVPITSANYLAPMLLEAADVPQPAYFSYLLDLQETLPAVTAFACALTDGGYLAPDALTGAEAEALRSYEQVMYNSLFDTAHRNERFFGVGE